MSGFSYAVGITRQLRSTCGGAIQYRIVNDGFVWHALSQHGEKVISGIASGFWTHRPIHGLHRQSVPISFGIALSSETRGKKGSGRLKPLEEVACTCGGQGVEHKSTCPRGIRIRVRQKNTALHQCFTPRQPAAPPSATPRSARSSVPLILGPGLPRRADSRLSLFRSGTCFMVCPSSMAHVAVSRAV